MGSNTSFFYDLVMSREGGLKVWGEKELYNTDEEQAASRWVRQEIRGLKAKDAPQLSSAIRVKQRGHGALPLGAVGYMLNSNNNIYKNQTSVGLFTSAFSDAHGLSVIPSNLLKCTALFTARKTIKDNWINQKDEYLAPNEDI